MKTVLNPLTLAAMPAMKAASRPVSATPSTPLGSSCCMSSGMALLYTGFGELKLGIRAIATSPGMMVRPGMKILGKAPISGVRCPAERSLADRARCTSAKFVVQ